jgi:prepilin peptidase CpaA
VEQVYTVFGLLATGLFPIALVYAGICDLRRFEIPNWVSVVLFLGFFPIALIVGWDGPALLDHLLAGCAMLALGFFLFAGSVIGGGDAKLLAAVAVWTGWALLPAFLVVMALSGGVIAVFLIVFRHIPLPAGAARIGWLRGLHEKRKDVPYAVAIAAGGLFVYSNLGIFVSAGG